MAEKSYVVEGFSFQSKAEAEAAQNELKGVTFMRSKIDYNNISAAVASYNSMNNKKLFKTPLGIAYMNEVRNSIIEYGVEEADIPPVIVSAGTGKVVLKKQDDNDTIYKSRFINMIIINVILIITIVLFGIIATNSENLNIINYQNRIEKDYQQREDNLAAWSNELKAKEKELENKAKDTSKEETTTKSSKKESSKKKTTKDTKKDNDN